MVIFHVKKTEKNRKCLDKAVAASCGALLPTLLPELWYNCSLPADRLGRKLMCMYVKLLWMIYCSHRVLGNYKQSLTLLIKYFNKHSLIFFCQLYKKDDWNERINIKIIRHTICLHPHSPSKQVRDFFLVCRLYQDSNLLPY